MNSRFIVFISFRQSGALTSAPPSSTPPQTSANELPAASQVNNMPQPPGGVPRTTATVHPYNVDARQMAVSFNLLVCV